MDTAPSSPVQPAAASRPRNRRKLIAQAAALAFSECGYHGASMEKIASTVGISAPALYRHYPGKYSLFLEATLQLVQELLDATAADALPAAQTPDEQLQNLLDAVIAVTQANRRTGSIYRHEAHYLTAEDHAVLGARFDELTRRVLASLAGVAPQLNEVQARFLAVGAFGVIASITAHHTVLAPRKTTQLLRTAALAVLEFPLDDEPPRAEQPAPAPEDGLAQPPEGGRQPRRELLLTQAVTLFYRRGYREVTIEELGAAAGVTASAVYRHFPGKSAVLLQACQRAAGRLAAATEDALAPATSPREALGALASAYVRHTFAHHELMAVYFSDFLNLSPEEQAQLRGLQLLHIDIWVELVADLRPGLSAAEVRFLVHGALNLAADLGRFTHFEQSPYNLDRISRLLLQALGVER